MVNFKKIYYFCHDLIPVNQTKFTHGRYDSAFLNLTVALKLAIPVTRYKGRVSACMTWRLNASLYFLPQLFYLPRLSPSPALKDQLLNSSCFVSHAVPSQLFTMPLQHENTHRQSINEWFWLCYNTIFTHRSRLLTWSVGHSLTSISCHPL